MENQRLKNLTQIQPIPEIEESSPASAPLASERKRTSRLTLVAKLDNLSDMKKISAREFQKRFGQIAESMREGQTVEVTMHGKAIGRFTKNRTRRTRMPDFVSLLESESCSKSLGNQILKEFHDSLS